MAHYNNITTQQKVCSKCGGFGICYRINSPYLGQFVYVCLKCTGKHLVIKDLF